MAQNINQAKLVRQALEALGPEWDPWSPEYDFLEHDHWLLSKFDPECFLCKKNLNDSKSSPKMINNATRDLIQIETPLSTPPFVTPGRTNIKDKKANGTFTFSACKSAAKAFNSSTNDLINLNDTYGLYTTAIGWTPDWSKPKCMEEEENQNEAIFKTPKIKKLQKPYKEEPNYEPPQAQQQLPNPILRVPPTSNATFSRATKNSIPIPSQISKPSGIPRIPKTFIPVRSSRI